MPPIIPGKWPGGNNRPKPDPDPGNGPKPPVCIPPFCPPIGDQNNDAHRGRIQIQGNDLPEDMSWAWSQPTPPAKATALTELDNLWSRLSRRQKEIRDEAYAKAKSFIRGGPYHAQIIKTFQNRNLPSRNKDARVDIEIRKGIAFE